jgi:hypothetical protein
MKATVLFAAKKKWRGHGLLWSRKSFPVYRPARGDARMPIIEALGDAKGVAAVRWVALGSS